MAESEHVPLPRRRRARTLLGLLGLLLATAAVGVAFGHRDRVVAAVPPLGRAFAAVGVPVNVTGLDIRRVRASVATEQGQRVLVVEGDIVSLRQTSEDVPELRFALRRPDGRDAYVWTAAASESRIEPAATLHFRAKLVSPPQDGHDVFVRFVEKEGGDPFRFWK